MQPTPTSHFYVPTLHDDCNDLPIKIQDAVKFHSIVFSRYVFAELEHLCYVGAPYWRAPVLGTYAA